MSVSAETRDKKRVLRLEREFQSSCLEHALLIAFLRAQADRQGGKFLCCHTTTGQGAHTPSLRLQFYVFVVRMLKRTNTAKQTKPTTTTICRANNLQIICQALTCVHWHPMLQRCFIVLMCCACCCACCIDLYYEAATKKFKRQHSQNINKTQ